MFNFSSHFPFLVWIFFGMRVSLTQARNLFGIDDSESYNEEYLRKRFKELCLLAHPDKTTCDNFSKDFELEYVDSHDLFCQIVEAFNLLNYSHQTGTTTIGVNECVLLPRDIKRNEDYVECCAKYQVFQQDNKLLLICRCQEGVFMDYPNDMTSVSCPGCSLIYCLINCG